MNLACKPAARARPPRDSSVPYPGNARGGIEEMVRVLTSAPVRVQERVRPKPVALGKGFVIGGQDVVERYYRSEPVGCFLMEPAERSDTSFFTLKLEPRERFRGRFRRAGRAGAAPNCGCG